MRLLYNFITSCTLLDGFYMVVKHVYKAVVELLSGFSDAWLFVFKAS